MNVLISGNLSSLTPSLARSFQNEGFHVVLAGADAAAWKTALPKVTALAVAPNAAYFHTIVSAYTMDVVVYLPTREEQETAATQAGMGLDGLQNVLELCQKERVRKVFYISSTEVFGEEAFPTETLDPQPASPNGIALKSGEQYCAWYSREYGLSTLIVRVPYIYGAGETGGLLARCIRACTAGETLELPGQEGVPAIFLYGEDAADFLLRALDAKEPGCQYVNLSAAPITYGRLAELLRESYPDAKITFRERNAHTRPAVVTDAKRSFDWIAEHDIARDLPGIARSIAKPTRRRTFLLDRVRGKFPRYQTYLMWIEVFLGALLMDALTRASGALIEFRGVDFRLLYVILFGVTYGTRAALAAAALAGVSALANWGQLGYGWIDLIYNVSNWLPFVMYLTAGIISGTYHDKKENEGKHLEGQLALVKEKYSFLYDLYQEVCQLKNQFHRQLVGSRDSFGRIFNIARELDSLEEEEVIFKALNVLEDVMENRSIAIYSIGQNSSYARLEIYSSSLGGQINKSLDLKALPELLGSMESGEIFQNSAMQPGYPAYFVPIKNGSQAVAAVVVWKAGFDQYSQYYQNLLKVICDLIQSSINRAAVFLDANIDRVYLPYTRILQAEPFKKVLRVKSKMKKNKIGDHLLVCVQVDERKLGRLGWMGMYPLISGEIRAEDYIGVLEDGVCYILFSQADRTNARQIFRRLEQHGITCQPVDDQAALELCAPAETAVFEPLQSVSVYRN